MGVWIFFGGAAALLLWYINRYNRQKDAADAAEREAWLGRIREAEEWVLEHGANLPEVTSTGLQLQKGERLFWVGDAEWWELRKRTKRINYHGPVASVELMKGLRYRAGSITPSIESESVLCQVDAGVLYVTDKRLFFDGHEKNTTMRWSSLAGIAAFMGGFEIEKQTGKSPYLKLSQEPERATAIASWVLQGGVE